MIRIVTSFAVLTATLALALPASAANLTRTFVSSSGNDSNACTITAPCASFARAYTQVLPSGIIAALDPGKYGPLTIGMPVTINGNGWAAITGTASGNGITISSGLPEGTIVILNGIEIDGAGAAYNGIEVDAPAAVTITNCILQNFTVNGGISANTGNGILLAPTSGTLTATISNTTASNNFNAGIAYLPPSGSPSANIALDHVVANANTDGFLFNVQGVSGGASNITVSNSVASNNPVPGIALGGGAGIYIDNGSGGHALSVSIDNSTASNNGVGIVANNTVKVVLNRSFVTQNNVGIENEVTTNGKFFTMGNNCIELNNSPNVDNALQLLSPGQGFM